MLSIYSTKVQFKFLKFAYEVIVSRFRYSRLVYLVRTSSFPKFYSSRKEGRVRGVEVVKLLRLVFSGKSELDATLKLVQIVLALRFSIALELQGLDQGESSG